MRKGKSTRGVERRSDLIVGSDWAEVSGMEVVQLPNKKVDVVRGDKIVLLQIVESRGREGCREIPPEDVNGRARVLGRAHNMHHRGVKRKGRGKMNLNYNQRETVELRSPLKVMESTDKEGRHSKTSVQR